MTAADGAFGHTGNPEVDRILSQVGVQVGKYEEIRKQLAELRGWGEAADGQVIAEVLPGGSLAALEIKPRALRLGSEALTDAVLDAAAAAADDVTARMNELMEPLVGQATSFSEALRGNLLSMNPGADTGGSDPKLDEALAAFQEMRRKYRL